MFGNDRTQMRRMFCDSWRKAQAGEALEPLERRIAEVVAAHPEYHPLLVDVERALDLDYLPEHGESNPFLHMGMHIAIAEQLATDRPTGILSVYQALNHRLGGAHETEHAMMEALGETLWEAQRSGQPPDEKRYLTRLRRLAGMP